VGKLSLPSPFLRLRGSSRLTIDAIVFEAGSHPCAPLYPFTPSTVLSLPPSLRLKKERGTERGESEKEGNRKKYQDLESVAFPSSLSHGGAGLYTFQRYARPPIETCEVRVHGSGGARGLPCAGGPGIPHTCRWVRGVLCGVL
jgi:hypothetical protein